MCIDGVSLFNDNIVCVTTCQDKGAFANYDLTYSSASALA